MSVSNAVLRLLCTMVLLGFPLSSAIRAKGSVLPTGSHRSKVGESNHPSVKLASSTHTVTYVATNVSPDGATSNGTRSKSGSRLSHDSKARFAGVGENGLCCIADGIEEGAKAQGKGLEEGLKAQGKGLEEGLKAQGEGHGKGFEQGMKSLAGSHEQGMNSLAGGMKYLAGSIAFSSVAICFAIRK
jgi:hypothetical protein